jgi:hypothetical protein
VVYVDYDPVVLEPGLVPVQQWRPGSPAGAKARSAMWGGVARKR